MNMIIRGAMLAFNVLANVVVPNSFVILVCESVFAQMDMLAHVWVPLELTSVEGCRLWNDA